MLWKPAFNATGATVGPCVVTMADDDAEEPLALTGIDIGRDDVPRIAHASGGEIVHVGSKRIAG